MLLIDFFMEDLPETNPEGFFNEVSNQVCVINHNNF